MNQHADGREVQAHPKLGILNVNRWAKSWSNGAAGSDKFHGEFLVVKRKKHAGITCPRRYGMARTETGKLISLNALKPVKTKSGAAVRHAARIKNSFSLACF